jgi:hypothetical protein
MIKLVRFLRPGGILLMGLSDDPHPCMQGGWSEGNAMTANRVTHGLCLS